MLDILIKNGQVMQPKQGLSKVDIGIKSGKITALFERGTVGIASKEIIDCHDLWVLPGVIDPHVHFGFGDPKNDFRTESKNAALGGTTSVISFHRSPDIRDSAQAQIDMATKQSCIDFGFHFGITSHLHVETLREVSEHFGVSSYKLYMMYKGAAGLSKGFTDIDDGLLYAVLKEVKSIPNAILGVHCENVEVIPYLRDSLRRAGRDDLKAWNEQSPDFLEAENVHRVCYFAEKTDTPVNIVHLSSEEALNEVRRHRLTKDRAPIYVESCPHYLYLNENSIAGTYAKVNPPVRAKKDIEAMWAGVIDGSINTIGSDHVPRKRETKDKDIWAASNGFPGTGMILPIMLHEGYHNRGVDLERLVNVMSTNAAQIYNMPSKGSIAIGKDADLVIVDPNLVKKVDPTQHESNSDYSPYEGMDFKGWPVQTLVRGVTVMLNGKVTEQAELNPQGKYISR